MRCADGETRVIESETLVGITERKKAEGTMISAMTITFGEENRRNDSKFNVIPIYGIAFLCMVQENLGDHN